MGLAPAPMFPERTPTAYERKGGQNLARRGPMRFQEGVATDTDVPRDFVEGAMQGHRTAPGRMNHNTKVDTKYPEETMAQRAHVGSAAWTSAPTFLGEFAHGAGPDVGAIEYEMVVRSGGRYGRINPAMVID